MTMTNDDIVVKFSELEKRIADLESKKEPKASKAAPAPDPEPASAPKKK